jgi:hypothetical protein
MTRDELIRAEIRDVVDHPRWLPFRGLHDDHRAVDGTPAYLPAMMQVEQELVDFLVMCQEETPCNSLLQIGIGNCLASHMMWERFFHTVISIDIRDYGHPQCIVGSSQDPRVWEEIRHMEKFDVVFIDGDHSFQGVLADYKRYAPKASGIVALHDAIQRPGYLEVGVPELVETERLNVIGSEVGIAWLQR